MAPQKQEKSLYLFALMPDEELAAEIDLVRKAFADKFGCKAALKNPVHITLQAPFHMDPGEEEKLISLMGPIAYYQQPFGVKLENFGFFPDNRVVFIQPVPSESLRLLQRNLVSRLKKAQIPEVQYTRSFHPHITIGYRDLTPEIFQEAQALYEEKHFRGQLQVNSFFLWKHDGKQWQIRHEFKFLGDEKAGIFTAYLPSPLGLLEIQASKNALEQVGFLNNSEAGPEHTNAVTNLAVQQLKEYFDGKRTQFTVPLDPKGTDFQKEVWKLLEGIPFGEKISYLQLSRNFGDEKAIRAVGTANGKNPIPIIIPCHRVVGTDGKLTGYSGGLSKKQWLLEHEQRHSGKGQQLLF